MSSALHNDNTLSDRRTYTLRVVSLNVWNPGPDKIRRNEELATELRKIDPDVVLLQEMNNSRAQLELFSKGTGLQHRAWTEGVAIFCRFKLENFAAPKVWRQPYCTPLNQLLDLRKAYFCCATFQHEGVIHHVSAHHWDSRGITNRNRVSKEVSKRLSQLPSTTAIICGGDFNARMDSQEVQQVFSGGNLTNSDPKKDSIDYILYRGAVMRSPPVRKDFEKLTDHPMLISELEFSIPGRAVGPALT